MTDRHRFIEDALAEHRDEASPSLPIEMHVARLIDERLCRRLNEKLRSLGGAWERRLATSNLYRQIPDASGLYMFVWKTAAELEHGSGTWRYLVPLYVGMAGGASSTGTLRRRYSSEYKRYVEGDPENIWATRQTDTRAARLRRWLSLETIEYWFIVAPEADESELSNLERRLLSVLNPPLNDSGKPKLRTGKTTTAF